MTHRVTRDHRKKLNLVFLFAMLARIAGAQTSDTTRHPPGATVSGIVHDSVAHTPLAGAMVELVIPDGLTSFVPHRRLGFTRPLHTRQRT